MELLGCPFSPTVLATGVLNCHAFLIKTPEQNFLLWPKTASHLTRLLEPNLVLQYTQSWLLGTGKEAVMPYHELISFMGMKLASHTGDGRSHVIVASWRSLPHMHPSLSVVFLSIDEVGRPEWGDYPLNVYSVSFNSRSQIHFHLQVIFIWS